jgi:hypothetical protein
MPTMRRPGLILLLVATLLLGACASGDDDEAATPSTTTAADGDLEAFCAGFDELAEGRVPGDASRLDLGDGSPEGVAAAYAAQRAAVEEIAAAAPDDVRDDAETYLAVIDRRAAAAADGEAMQPTSDLRAMQGEINELLAYARQACPDFGSS